MATLRIPDEDRVIRDAGQVQAYLAKCGIDYERSIPLTPVPSSASPDVIDVKPDTPNLETMLARFSTEHWHDEDEVRLIVEGRGLFHIHPANGPVFAIEVEAGDLIRVPKGTHHWFDLCGERRIRAIRLFQDPAGWTPHYTLSGVDRGFQPVCFGQAYFPRGGSDAVM